jgi:hypothetical protein
MKTFDHRAAWVALARPAIEALPADLRALYDRTAAEAAEMRQGPSLDVIWPETDLRAAFEAADPDVLALAARDVYRFGHWYPSGKLAGGGYDLPGRSAGVTWKFANYADQVLRVRYHVGREVHRGTGLMIIDGEVRVGYSSPDSWSWFVVGPATARGVADASAAAERIRRSYAGVKGRKADEAAWTAMDAERVTYERDAHQFMIEESERVDPNDDDLSPTDATPAERRAKLDAEHAKKIRQLEAKHARLAWFVDRGLPTGNAIYYTHNDIVCIGWRRPLTAAAVSKWLDILVEYPYAYELRRESGPIISTRS